MRTVKRKIRALFSPGSQLFCHGLDCNCCLLCHGRQHRDLEEKGIVRRCLDSKGRAELNTQGRRRHRTRISSPQSYFCSISLPRSPSGRRRSSRTSPLSWSSDRYPSWMPISWGYIGKKFKVGPHKLRVKETDKLGRWAHLYQMLSSCHFPPLCCFGSILIFPP